MTLASKFSDKLLFLFAVSMTLTIFQYHRIPIALVLLLFYMVVICFEDIKIRMTKDNSIFIILLVLSVITMGICFTSEMGNSWKLCGFFNFAIFLVLVVFKFFYSERISTLKIDIVIKGLKIGCLLNFAWCYIQLALYNFAKIDINDLIFHQTLHLMETASAYKDAGTKYCVSGFGWHPAQLLPIIVLSFFMFDSFIIRLLILGVCVSSNNSTCLCASLMCILGEVLVELIRGKGKLRTRRLLYNVVLLFVLIISTFIKNDIIAEVTDKISELFGRMGQVFQSDSIEDTSTYIHVRYYTYYPTIFGNQNWFEWLFGIGYECSGYPYTKYLNQYTVFNDWIPETDYINFILGRGWIWTILYYVWLIKGFIKARKVSIYYLFYILIISVCGVLYNNQFFWVVIAEMIFIEAAQSGKNIFDIPLNKKLRLAQV